MVLLASACGSGGGSGTQTVSRLGYVAKLKTIAKESDTAQHALEKAFHAKSSADLARILSTFAAAEKRIGDQVAAIKPPSYAQAANAKLAKGLQDTASEVQAVVPKIKALPDANAGIAYLRKQPQTKGGQEVDAALARLKQLSLIKSTS